MLALMGAMMGYLAPDKRDPGASKTVHSLVGTRGHGDYKDDEGIVEALQMLELFHMEASQFLMPVSLINHSEYCESTIKRFQNAKMSDPLMRLTRAWGDKIKRLVVPGVQEWMEKPDEREIGAHVLILAMWALSTEPASRFIDSYLSEKGLDCLGVCDIDDQRFLERYQTAWEKSKEESSIYGDARNDIEALRHIKNYARELLDIEEIFPKNISRSSAFLARYDRAVKALVSNLLRIEGRRPESPEICFIQAITEYQSSDTSIL